MSSRAPLIAGVGHATLDFVGVVPGFPKRDTKTLLPEASLQGGGPAATALVTAAMLGCRTRFAGKVAEDDFGRFILRSLREAGVDTDFVITSRGRLSPFSFIAVDRDSGDRTIFYTYGDSGPLEPEDIDFDSFLLGASLLLVDGHHVRAQIAAAEAAQRRDIPVVLDAGSLREGMGELVGLSDILIASERFVSEVAPRGEPEDSLLELQSLGPRTVVITLGEAGSVGLTGDKLVKQPAYPVTTVDTTGAGDVYHGAFAVAFARGRALEECMQLASAAAALKCTALGGRAGIPRERAILEFLGWSQI